MQIKFKFSKLMLVAFLFLNILSYSQQNNEPITETYLSSSRVRSGIAMGGIGTGSIELRKDGNFYNWTIFNNYPLSCGPAFELPSIPKTSLDQSLLFFLVRYQVEGQKPKLKLLQLNNSLQEGAQEGIIYYYPWMTAVDKIEYQARFPFTNITFSDAEMPFDIQLEAFSPFIPHDVKNSSLPGAYFNFTVKSKTDKKVEVMLLGSLRNLVGYDNIEKAFESRIINKQGYKFFIQSVSGLDSLSTSNGQMGLGVIGGNEVSYYLGWEHKHPYYEKLLVENKLANVDDTHNRNTKMKDGKLVGHFSGTGNDQRCFSSIAVSHQLNGKAEFKASFFMNWNFPNKYGAISYKEDNSLEKRKERDYKIKLKPTKIIGHYYQNYFSGIDSIASYFSANQTDLTGRSHQFVDDMYSSSLDQYVLDQVNSNLNTFVTSSTLTKSGQFGIREGMTSSQPWGPNSTLDVALYGSPMIVALYPELQKSMMREHSQLQTPDGEVNHGLGFDLDFNQNGTWGVFDRVDLVPNYIQMVLRDYMYTNDKSYIKEMWPTVKLGIEYILTKRDKDCDQMPDMTGVMCSYDNFPMYGLASYIQSQWIAALTMASKVATDLGDKELAKKYQAIATKGSQLMESKIWNGSYYNLSNDYLGKKGIDNGCLTDQLMGQWVAHNAGMGYIFDKEHVQKSLQSILEKSFIDNSFLRNCSWPATPELFPIHASDLWVDQANTPWTGVELAFASFLIYENQVTEGLKVIKGVEDRYRKAGLYFDQQEFGGHYFRPMSAWSILNAFLGYSVNCGKFTFNPKLTTESFNLFFATPEGTALYKKTAASVSIVIKTGEMNFNQLRFQNSGVSNAKALLYLDNKIVKNAKIKSEFEGFNITLPNTLNIKKGSVLVFK
jgi:uncharacterized protein (DUF608 family)